MAADVGEGPDLAIVAANDDDALAEEIDGPPFARIGNFAFMTNHLGRGAQEGALFSLEEFVVEVEPAGQADIV